MGAGSRHKPNCDSVQTVKQLHSPFFFEDENVKGKITVSGSYLCLCDANGKELCFIGSRHLDDLETAIKQSRHLAETNSTDVCEVILGDLPPQNEDANR